MQILVPLHFRFRQPLREFFFTLSTKSKPAFFIGQGNPFVALIQQVPDYRYYDK